MEYVYTLFFVPFTFQVLVQYSVQYINYLNLLRSRSIEELQKIFCCSASNELNASSTALIESLTVGMSSSDSPTTSPVIATHHSIRSAQRSYMEIECNESCVQEIGQLGARESSQRNIFPDSNAVGMRNWSAERVAELVAYVLRDVGTDEATVASVRLEFTREAVDGAALTRLGPQELSQRFGQTCGPIISDLSTLCGASKQPKPLPVVDTTTCSETVTASASTVPSDVDANSKPECPTDTAVVRSVPDGVSLIYFPTR